ncbi:MAG: c-type cytochrome [Xanthobacteraceae bacterium]
MSMRSNLLVVSAALAFASGAAAETPNLGQSITEADLALWDISVGPDGVGLPQGSGTPAQGKAVYEQKCELCHGKEASGGKNAALVSTKDRTVTSYVPHATTIFDFTRRAMPWPQPKSLTADETYAVTAYLLALAKIIGENDVMNAETLPRVRMPNRDGFVSKYPEKH